MKKCKKCKWFQHPDPYGKIKQNWCYNFGRPTTADTEACSVGLLRCNSNERIVYENHQEMKKEHVYELKLTERQAILLSYACDQFARLIQGQDWSYQELFEEAWEKRCKEAVGGHGMDDEWDGGWNNMRHDAEELCKQIKKRFWGLDIYSQYGIHYDKTADILFDIHQVIRHQLWLDDKDRSQGTVDSSEAMQFGDEPLAKIKKV